MPLPAATTCCESDDESDQVEGSPAGPVGVGDGEGDGGGWVVFGVVVAAADGSVVTPPAVALWPPSCFVVWVLPPTARAGDVPWRPPAPPPAPAVGIAATGVRDGAECTLAATCS